MGPGFAQGIGLGLAAAFGHGLGEVGEQNGEPQPERDLNDESFRFAAAFLEYGGRGEQGAAFGDEHDRVLGQRAGIEFFY